MTKGIKFDGSVLVAFLNNHDIWYSKDDKNWHLIKLSDIDDWNFSKIRSMKYSLEKPIQQEKRQITQWANVYKNKTEVFATEELALANIKDNYLGTTKLEGEIIIKVSK